MRGVWRRIVSIALLALFLAFLPRQVWVITVQPKHEDNQQRADNGPNKIIRPETSEERTADYTEALAYYTEALVVVTAILAFVSVVQIGFLIRADKTARRAADAAKSSADVAERTMQQTYAPYLDIVITPKAIIHHMIGGAVTAKFNSGVFAEYTISNYSSSPAVVLEVYHGCVKGRGIPKTIDFPPPASNLHRTINIGGSKESEPISVPFPLNGMLNVTSDEITWVGIQIRYRDIFGEQYVTNAWFTYSDVRASFATYGGPKYNNRRKLTDEERQLAEARDIFN